MLFIMATSKSMGSAQALGIAIKRLRAQREMTQEALAHAAEISLTSLARIETGAHGSRLDTVMRLAKALGISAAELVGESEEVMRKGTRVSR
jgi:XRE family transcriptional regulator, regulator of sulfur utilization